MSPSPSPSPPAPLAGQATLRAHRDDHVILPVRLALPDGPIDTFALLDSGATSSFVDERFAQRHSLSLSSKPYPRPLLLIDGMPIASGDVTHETSVTLVTGGHAELISLDVCRLARYPIVLGVTWLRRHNPSVDWRANRLTFDSLFCARYCLHAPPAVRALPVVHFAGTLSQMEAEALPDPPEYAAKLRQLVPPQYHDLLHAFSRTRTEELPRRRPGRDHAIELEPGTSPPWGPIYSLSEREHAALREWLAENLRRGFIRPSKSPAGAPMLFAEKKSGDLRPCHDYRGLNAITIKNRMPLPLISDSLDRLRGARIFTKLDIRGAYNLVRIREGDEWKTAFRTRYGLFETLVMPFGLTNAPATFQAIINDLLRDLIDVTVLVYLDDILVFSANPAQHEEHVREVLRRLANDGFYLNAEKCEFSTTKTEYLGYTISTSGISMSRDKVAAVLDWPAPTCVRELQAFLGFANFYRRFIEGYSRRILPMTRLLRKGIAFEFDVGANAAFCDLKLAFTQAPVLVHYDPARETQLEVDASDGAISGILSQKHDDGVFHPIAFMSRRLEPAELNYGIGEKELLAIVHSVRVWRHYFEGLHLPFNVLTDHNNLTAFQTARILTRRQARWSEILNSYKYTLTYRAGRLNGKADALSRRPDLLEGGKAANAPAEVLFRPLTINGTSTTLTTDKSPGPAPDTSPLLDDIRQALASDPTLSTLIDQASHGQAEGYEIQDGLLRLRGRVCVPNQQALRVAILRQAHDGHSAGHLGRDKTLKLVSRDFHWPGLRSFVAEYVKSCPRCQRTKAPRHAPYGRLQPLPIPTRPWLSISMDHIVDLPFSRGHNAILVVVDRHSKQAHFIPARTTDTASDLARQFVDRIYRLHGLPADIVSDRGSLFRSHWWTAVLKQLRIHPNLSTAHHPQTDGQTERVNQVLEQYLRTYCTHLQDDWHDLLPLAEFAYNNAPQASVGFSPFFVNHGYNPRAEFSASDGSVPAAREHVAQLQAGHEAACQAILQAQRAFSEQADRHRREAPDFQVGDRVLLRRTHLRTDRPSQKLDDRLLGPFEILSPVGRAAFRLKLPPTFRAHPVFHVSLLEKWYPDKMNAHHQVPVAPVAVDEEGEHWEVEAIHDARWRPRTGPRRGRSNAPQKRSQRNSPILEFYVRWAGFTQEEDSWVLASDFDDDDELVLAFYREHPRHPMTEGIRAALDADRGA